MTMIVRLRFFLSLLLLAMAPSGAVADDPTPASRLDAILAAGELRVGMTGDYAPFDLDRAPEGWRGFDVDLTAGLATALGVRRAIVRTSWPTLARDFDADRFDLAAGGVSITFDRARKGYFSSPILRDGKTPIARCADAARFREIADIDRPDVRVIVNPGGTNERFARERLKTAPVAVHADNATIFEEIAAGRADVMITDASEARYQQKLHPGALCAIHPDAPFDFAEKAWWLRRDEPLKRFVDLWLHVMGETGQLAALRAKWFD